MTRPPGSAHGAREWNDLRGPKVGRYVTTHINAVDLSQPNGYSPAGTMNAATRRRQLAAIDAENKQLLWRMQARAAPPTATTQPYHRRRRARTPPRSLELSGIASSTHPPTLPSLPHSPASHPLALHPSTPHLSLSAPHPLGPNPNLNPNPTQTLRPSYSLSAIEADYARRNELLESRKRGQGLRLSDHYAAQAAMPI